MCCKPRPFDLIKESRNVAHDGRAASLRQRLLPSWRGQAALRPAGRNYTETIMTLAGLSRFVVADLSGSSVPHELHASFTHIWPFEFNGERHES